jgi:hypothetical protein
VLFELPHGGEFLGPRFFRYRSLLTLLLLSFLCSLCLLFCNFAIARSGALS